MMPPPQTTSWDPGKADDDSISSPSRVVEMCSTRVAVASPIKRPSYSRGHDDEVVVVVEEGGGGWK